MKFCFVSIENSFYHTLYCDFNKAPNSLVEVPAKLVRGRFINALIGWKLPMPWIRSKIFYFLYNNPTKLDVLSDEMKKGSDVCFIVYGRVFDFYGPCIVNYLKKLNYQAKVVLYLGDVVNTYTYNIDSIRTHFDMVFSCDRKDAKEHGLMFLQEPYSQINTEKVSVEYDFLFVGSEKGRFDKLIRIYEALTAKDYKCVFYINGVNESRQVYRDKIIYNTYLEYDKVVNLLKKSRCIIEVLQIDADTTTTRYSEALLYKKYLLTDSVYLSKNTDIAPNIICFDYKDWSVIDRIYKPLEYDLNRYIDELSIKTMTNNIEKSLLR